VGGEVALDRGVYRYGVIRFARDPQMMYNLNRTAMAEWISQGTKSPWLVTPKMIAQHRSQWDTSNLHTRPYLMYTPDKDAPTNKPERIAPPEMPVALSNEAMMASDDMKGDQHSQRRAWRKNDLRDCHPTPANGVGRSNYPGDNSQASDPHRVCPNGVDTRHL
jgi:hypothetical protein